MLHSRLRLLVAPLLVIAAAISAAAVVPLAHAAPSAPSGALGGAARAADDRHILVRFRPGAAASERAALHRRNTATVAGVLRPERVEVVRLARDDSVQAALARYRRNPNVEFAEPNKAVSGLATPNDTYFPSDRAGDDLWGLHNTGQNSGTADADVDAPEGWDALNFSGSPWPTGDFAVGVVDTGVDAGHEDLAGKAITPCHTAITGTGTLAPGCADDHGHGTHVAGTVAATGNNGKGIVGVAPNARIYACKALDATGSGFVADVVACMNEIVAKRDTHNIRVLSMSLGSYDSSETERAAVDFAWDSGVLVVAAAGNDGDSRLSYPAGYANAVSVAATDRTDARWADSNANSDVELSAPGDDIVSTVPPSSIFPSGYAVYDGTSMATPHAAGVAALVARKYGKAGQALRDHIDASVDDLGPVGRDSAFGFGRVNLCRALEGSCDTTAPAGPAGLTAAAGDGRVTLDWADNTESDLAGYRVYRRNSDGSWSSTPRATTTTSAFTDTGLANGTTYTYRVTAVDQAGNNSRPSAEVSATPTDPTTPAEPAPAPAAEPESAPAPAPEAASAPAPAKIHPARLKVTKAVISGNKLTMKARITAHSTGFVTAKVTAAGSSKRFRVPIEGREIAFTRRLTARQAALGTAIVSISYAGNQVVSSDWARLRVARYDPALRISSRRVLPERSDGELVARGTLKSSAVGTIRVIFEWQDGTERRRLYTKVRQRNGKWRAVIDLPAGVDSGWLTVEYGGYMKKRLSGERTARGATRTTK